MLIEAVAAAVVGAALLWLVLQPMLSMHRIVPAVDLDAVEPEETPRGQALLALTEIEFDRATGKLSESDYQMLNARYSAIAVAVLDAPTAGVRCLVHGVRSESDSRFCAECGAGLVTADDHCVNCGVPMPSDAQFCPGCGTRVA